VRTFQCREHRQLIHQDASGLANSFFRRHHTVGGDIQHQFAQVSTLLNTGAFDSIADAAHRAEGRVKHDATNRVCTVIGQRTNVTGHVAAALLNLDLHFQLAGVGQRGDHVIRVDDFNVMGKVDVSGGHNARALTTQGQSDFFTIVQLEDHALEVQQDVDHVFP